MKISNSLFFRKIEIPLPKIPNISIPRPLGCITLCYIIMGNENRRSDFDQENWETLTKIGVKTVLKNRMTFSLLDLYECEEADSASSRRAEEIFEWRKQRTTQEPLPLLYHFEVQRAMIGSSQRHRVFTEHITRVGELPPFSKQEAFLLLEHIIEVLPALYKQFGLFHANVCTVGVNDVGRTKVWVNENFARNYPEEEDVIKNPSQNLELAIVNNLVRMLKTKVYNNDIAPDYPFSLNFLQTLRYIKEARQRYPEYTLSKVYLNRSEFNEAYRVALGQRAEGSGTLAQAVILEPATQGIRAKGTTPRKTEALKTEGSESLMYYSPVYNLTPSNPPFAKPNAQQVVYYPVNAVPAAQTPLYNQQIAFLKAQSPIVNQSHNKTTQIPRDSKERQLEHSYYLSPLPSTANNAHFLQQPNRFPSPPKRERKSPSPSQFLKKVSQGSPRSFSPNKHQQKIPQNNQIAFQNRSISLSPSKRRENNIAPTSQKMEEQPKWVRPASVNKALTRRELSRIVQEEQTRQDSFYVRSPLHKGPEEGFNVELVESIYVKSSETQEDF